MCDYGFDFFLMSNLNIWCSLNSSMKPQDTEDVVMVNLVLEQIDF